PVISIFASGETEPGDAGQDTTLPADDARYFGLLECLLERIVDLLDAVSGNHYVGIRVLDRHIYYQEIGKRAPLNSRRIGEIILKILSGFGEKIRMVPETVSRYDSRVRAEFVLADFVANHCRRTLSKNSWSLSKTERKITERLSTPTRSGNPSKSHLSASGVPRLWVSYANGRMTSRPSRSLEYQCEIFKRWACEQANEWVNLQKGGIFNGVA
ncbi:MAG: hypothetical protein JW902_17195, partial [Syntrophaceae bacterium]|nr:hypothetical protein [Syntrophaceae bacterium]